MTHTSSDFQLAYIFRWNGTNDEWHIFYAHQEFSEMEETIDTLFLYTLFQYNGAYFHVGVEFARWTKKMLCLSIILPWAQLKGKKLFDPGNETEFGIWIHEIAFNICRGLIYIPSLRERDRFETSDSEARNSEIDGIRGFLFSRYTFIGFFFFFFHRKNLL